MDPASILLKSLLDRVLKLLPDASDKRRLRVQEKLLQGLVDRNTELEDAAEILARVAAQRDLLIADVIRLQLRVAELEAEAEQRASGEE